MSQSNTVHNFNNHKDFFFQQTYLALCETQLHHVRMKVYRISVSETIALSITFGNMVRYLDGNGEQPTTSHVLVHFTQRKMSLLKISLKYLQ